MVQPVLEFAGDAAPIGRAQNQRVAGEEIGWLGLVEGAVDRLGAVDGPHPLQDRPCELLSEATAVVEYENAGHR